MRKFPIAAALAALTTLCVPAIADVEKTIEYRQSVYRVIAWNFGPLRAMAGGKMDFDAAAAGRHATRIAQLSTMLDDAYAERSTAEGSDALPEIWENWADFESKLTAFQAEAQTLATTAAGGDEDATKAQFLKMAGTCKGCHDLYKE